MKSTVLVILLFFVSSTIFSQEFDVVPDSNSTKQEQNVQKQKQQPKKSGGFNPKNLMIGGGFGLGLNRNGGMLNVAPIVGYRFHKMFHAALKVSYWYTWNTFTDPINNEHKVDDHMYTASVFGRLVLFKGLYLHVEPEYMNRTSFTTSYWNGDPISGYSLPPTARTDVFNFYVGPGFYQGFNGQGGMFIQLLWNLNQTDDSYYSNPYLSVGFTF